MPGFDAEMVSAEVGLCFPSRAERRDIVSHRPEIPDKHTEDHGGEQDDAGALYPGRAKTEDPG
jgi:hypothetical protein